MKTFHLKVDPNAAQNSIQRFRQAVKSRKPSEDNTLWCESYDSMARVMSVGRVELIEAIQKHAPDSIYELASLLDRDFANVHRDVKTLSEIGLIALEEDKSGNRERLRPVMLFDKIVWEMELPKKQAV